MKLFVLQCVLKYRITILFSSFIVALTSPLTAKKELCFEHFFRMLISIRKEKNLQKAQ